MLQSRDTQVYRAPLPERLTIIKPVCFLQRYNVSFFVDFMLHIWHLCSNSLTRILSLTRDNRVKRQDTPNLITSNFKRR